MKDFVISTEQVNRYGYRVLTSGIRLDNFKKNPVMLWEHGKEQAGRVPIGKWKNLRVEDGKLLATPVFDEDDPFAQTIKSKVEKGILSAASVWLDPITFSSDPKHLLKGQTRSTLTVSELLEASITAIPGNAGATIKLKFSDGKNEVPKISKQMNEVCLKLGLGEDASQNEVIAKINEQEDKAVEVLLALGKTKGLINEDNQEEYRALAKKDFDTTRKLIDQHKTEKTEEPSQQQQTIAEAILSLKQERQSTEASQESLAEKYLRLSKEAPEELSKLMRENPKEYQELEKAYIESV